MKPLIFVFLSFYIIGCTKTDKKIKIDEFNLILKIPEELENVTPDEHLILKEDGINLIEEAYPNKKIKTVAIPLFELKNGKYNRFNVQYREIESEEFFFNEFQSANEILVKSILQRKPKLEYSTDVGSINIDELSFKSFELNTLNNTGNQYKFTVYSRMFGNKKLDIIILSNDVSKRVLFDRILLESKFENQKPKMHPDSI